MAARGVQSRQGSMSTSPAPAAHNPTRVIGIERPLAAQVPHRPHVTPVRPQVPRIVRDGALGQDMVGVDVPAHVHDVGDDAGGHRGERGEARGVAGLEPREVELVSLDLPAEA